MYLKTRHLNIHMYVLFNLYQNTTANNFCGHHVNKNCSQRINMQCHAWEGTLHSFDSRHTNVEIVLWVGRIYFEYTYNICAVYTYIVCVSVYAWKSCTNIYNSVFRKTCLSEVYVFECISTSIYRYEYEDGLSQIPTYYRLFYSIFHNFNFKFQNKILWCFNSI